MYIINRSLAVISAKEPFYRWVVQLPVHIQETLEEFKAHYTTTLLIPAHTKQRTDDYIQSIYQEIFETELLSWDQEQRYWPQKRDHHLFSEWFTVTIYDTVLDTVDEELSREWY